MYKKDLFKINFSLKYILGISSLRLQKLNNKNGINNFPNSDKEKEAFSKNIFLQNLMKFIGKYITEFGFFINT